MARHLPSIRFVHWRNTCVRDRTRICRLSMPGKTTSKVSLETTLKAQLAGVKT